MCVVFSHEKLCHTTTSDLTDAMYHRVLCFQLENGMLNSHESVPL